MTPDDLDRMRTAVYRALELEKAGRLKRVTARWPTRAGDNGMLQFVHVHPLIGDVTITARFNHGMTSVTQQGQRKGALGTNEGYDWLMKWPLGR